MNTRLRVDFRKPGQSGRLTDLLTETGLTGMLEGVDYDAVVVLFSCRGTIVNESCALDVIADVITVCTAYVDMVGYIYQRQLTLGWTKKKT